MSSQPLFSEEPRADAAEQSVLGICLLNERAAAETARALSVEDFYQPANQVVFAALERLVDARKPTDAVSVWNQIEADGADRALQDGPVYLHTLYSMAPPAGALPHHIDLVKEAGARRQVMKLGTLSQTMAGSKTSGSANEILESIRVQLDAISAAVVDSDIPTLKDSMEEALAEVERVGTAGAVVGIPTGFPELDAKLHGLRPGQMVMIAGRPAMGKALALDTPIPTPAGWSTMGELAVGDDVFTPEGEPTPIIAVTDIMTDHLCYKVEFSDGTHIIADADHLWETHTPTSETPIVSTTRYLQENLYLNNEPHHTIPTTTPLNLPENPHLPQAPRDLGIALAGRPNRLTGTPADATDSPLDEPQHIPAEYLRASTAQRSSLLHAILTTDNDTPAILTQTGFTEYIDSNKRIAHNVAELAATLGYIVIQFITTIDTPLEDTLLHYHVVINIRTNTIPTTDTSEPFTRETAFTAIETHLPTAIHTHTPTHRTITAITLVDTVPVRCIQIADDKHLYLAGSAMIPTHNSTVMLDIVRHAAFHHNKSVLVFSLEMSRMEMMIRTLSAQARVELSNLQTGNLTEEEWERISKAHAKISKAIIGVDDSPGTTVQDMRAKARRWQNRYGLDLIAVDYLQLMNSHRKVESRQQEVSEISRNIKLLAKEFQVPIIALSQLNRGAEQRTDKRPMLSDLRESGCIPADTRIWRADTGGYITMGEIMENGYDGIQVWSMDADQKLVPSPIINAFATGDKEVFEVTTTSGRVVKASGNHPFYTVDGWVPLENLLPGSRIAVPRSVPEPLNAGIGWSENQLGLLAHMIGDGCVLKSTPVHYVSEDEANLQFVEKASNELFGITTRRVQEKGMNWISVYQPSPYPTTHGRYNPISGWFRDLGIFNLRSHEKKLPDILYSANDEEIAVFLGHLWATDGTIVEPARSGQNTPYIGYGTNSRELADGVVYFLSRIGIQARLGEVPQKNSSRNMFYITIKDVINVRLFHSKISINGIRQERLERYVTAIANTVSKSNTDTIPMEIWPRIEEIMEEKGLTRANLKRLIGGNLPLLTQKGMSRDKFNKIMVALDHPASLIHYGYDDIWWDQIKTINSLGTQPVYDITVANTHNFIAQGIVLSNSLEQDSDVVMMIHRDEVYNPELRVGEADLIIAKQRAGPTGIVPLVAQLHYSRFVPAAFQIPNEAPPFGD